ncbi:hypothetical protein ACFQU2_13660 [Siccirubricoccus deserti]
MPLHPWRGGFRHRAARAHPECRGDPQRPHPGPRPDPAHRGRAGGRQAAPGHGLRRQSSAPFVVATCLRLGRFGLAELLPQALADEATLALAARSRCEADPDTAFPTYFSGGVEVTLQDGSTLRWHERVNSGAGERKLDVAGASAKFMGAAGMVLDTAIATRARDAILAIDRHPIRHTTAVLGGAEMPIMA